MPQLPQLMHLFITNDATQDYEQRPFTSDVILDFGTSTQIFYLFCVKSALLSAKTGTIVSLWLHINRPHTDFSTNLCCFTFNTNVSIQTSND